MKSMFINLFELWIKSLPIVDTIMGHGLCGHILARSGITFQRVSVGTLGPSMCVHLHGLLDFLASFRHLVLVLVLF